jgi:hypothetical protein
MDRVEPSFRLKIGVFIFCAMAVMCLLAIAKDVKPVGLKPDEVKSALGMSVYLECSYAFNGYSGDTSPYGTGSENDLKE